LPAPRKRFGQHFLHDRGTLARIAQAFDPRPGDTIVEIGPGRGALTAVLLEHAAHMHAVEVDRDLAAHLARTFDPRRLTVHTADALRFDFCGLCSGRTPLRVSGNLPYNISTPLIFHLLDQAACVRDMCFMLQKEVVDRLSASPGGKDYGRLSVMVQWRCAVTRLFRVPPGAFEPPPKVDSAVVRLVPWPDPPVKVRNPRRFAQVVQAGFAVRRKTLRNALKGLLSAGQIAACGIDPGARAETLSVAEFGRLADTPGEA